MLGLVATTAVAQTPLDDYVRAPDPSYKWTDTGVRLDFGPLFQCTGYVLNLTSQTWKTTAWSQSPVWYHQLVLLYPIGYTFAANGPGAMYITGGHNGDGPPDAMSEDVLVAGRLCDEVGIPAAVLFQIPNQPIVYQSDPEKRHRSEDSAIAWTWYQFLVQNGSDPTVLLRFPMVKAAVRAMDAFSEHAATLSPGASITRFVIAGASKRGWDTWLVGAVDQPRVVGIIPMVLDILNLTAVLHHQYKSYGGWTFAFNDYYELNLTTWVDTPQFDAMVRQIDPLSYKDRLGNIPKLVVCSSDDEFMMLDDPEYWWDAMPGEKHLMIADNSEHSLVTGIVEVLDTACNFISSVIRRSAARPTFTWTIDRPSDDNHTITAVVSGGAAASVTVHRAITLSTTMRDFRWVVQPPAGCHFPHIKISNLCFQPIAWVSHTMRPARINPDGSAVYVAYSQEPLFGWEAMYVEAEFASDTGLDVPWRLTTQAVIVPDTFPFPDCTRQSCRGVLV